MQTDSAGAQTASTSGFLHAVPANRSDADPLVLRKMLTFLGKRACHLTDWERQFCFDCTHLIEQGNQLSGKQVAEIKKLRVKYAG